MNSTAVRQQQQQQQQQQPIRLFYSIATKYSVWIGLFLRLWIAWFLPWCMDQNPQIGVDYTDIDFYVFSDAAQYIQNGNNSTNASPYQRATYRYTPFLAFLLSKFPHREYGRVLFCFADTMCGYIIVQLRRKNRQVVHFTTTTTTTTIAPNVTTIDRNSKNEQQLNELQRRQHFEDALWWLYNPLAINICTRGSAESFVVLLPVLITVWITTNVRQQQQQQQSPSTTTSHSDTNINDNNDNWKEQQRHWLYSGAIFAGFFHGIAIHAKLYPIIYTLSFMTQFVTAPTPTIDTSQNRIHNNQRSIFYTFHHMVIVWIRRLLCPAPILFGTTTVMTFVAITYLAVQWFGIEALDEGLLYHFSRVDHRHNYSMHWYWIYLLRDRIVTASTTVMMDDSSSTIHPQILTKMIGIVLLFPQIVLLLYSSIGIAPYSLSLALFVQTFLFVAHNKVITAQYFTWYLCLLPLCSDQFRYTRRVRYALLILGLSIIVWLSSAYCLEMQGMAVHRVVWMASLFFFVANVNLLGALLSTTVEVQRQQAVEKVKNV